MSSYKTIVNDKRQITIPLEICEKLKINVNNQVEFVVDDDKVIFQKTEHKEENLCPCCKEVVYKTGSNVTFGDEIYHMECWFNKENQKKQRLK